MSPDSELSLQKGAYTTEDWTSRSLSFFLVRRTKRARMHTRVTEGARRERLPPSFLVSSLEASPLDALSRAWLTEEKQAPDKKERLLTV